MSYVWPPMLKSKSQQIREALLAEDRISALRITAHFYDRSPHTMIYRRGIDAYKHPAFYRQLGKDPHYALCDHNFRREFPCHEDDWRSY